MSAARFINWLHYNSSKIEHNQPINSFCTLTEGDDKNGVYDTRSIPVKRNKGAKYWLPNQNEWIKACYFNGKKYSCNIHAKDNLYSKKGWAYPYPHINIVGKSSPPNHYGIYDMYGNAAEWIENSRGIWKLAYGGSVIRNNKYAEIDNPEADDPDKAITTFGIRVCRTSQKKLRQLNHVYVYDSCIQTYSKKRISSVLKDEFGGEYVLVDAPGNSNDPLYSTGRVDYKYYISKYELTNLEYCKFLNAIASKSDPYRLYDSNMSTSVSGGIIRIKTSRGYVYKVKQNYEKRPVVYIGYYDLARYSNWLHYGCPHTGECVLGSTEGNEILGAYNTLKFENVRTGKTVPDQDFGKRNAGARYWIPNDAEWYKAAYYNPYKIGIRKYHDYPNQSDTPPSIHDCNYMVGNVLSVGEPYFVANVDSFAHSPSYFGTLQQGGNVWEWIEDWSSKGVGHRGLRGGSWSYTEFGLNAVNIDDGGIDDKLYVFGGRLCKSFDDNGYQSPPTEYIYDNKIIYYILFFLSAICLANLVLNMYIGNHEKK